MHPITPIILSGGSGTRLWPLSRKSYPKQFAKFIGEGSLLQQCATRLSGEGFAAPLIVTASDFRFIVGEQMEEIGLLPEAIVLEPVGRNTAPAILAATLLAAARDPDALLLVAPSDHLIPDAPAFRAAVEAGRSAAEAGRIVTFGIVPDRPETGYGYLELIEPDGEGPQPLARFVEKPDAVSAAKMCASGRHLWNAGLFLFRARDMIEACQTHQPEMLTGVGAALKEAREDLDFLRLAEAPWDALENISVDYALMEKLSTLSVVPFAGGWTDLGNWDALHAQSETDESGNALSGSALAMGCTDSLLRAETQGQQLVGLGLDKIIAIAMADAVLVAHKDHAQDVKAIVPALNALGALQAETFPVDHRPWGHFETLARADRFQVKRIHVKPGAALSLQSHVHRAEHWIVVSGTAEVTIGDTTELLAENQSTYIPLGAKHRLKNPGKLPMTLIEVQTGPYLGEDDIIRYHDQYQRD